MLKKKEKLQNVAKTLETKEQILTENICKIKHTNLKKAHGITLIALVITIIVLLILAGVTIAALSGPNGILSNADKAKEQTAESGAREKINIAVAGSYDNTGRFDSEKFKEEIQNMGGTILAEDDSTITVEMDGYEAVVDKETGEIISIEKSGGIRPQLEGKLYQTNGSEIQEGQTYDELQIKVTVTNVSDIDTIDSIILKNKNGEEQEKLEENLTNGEASFKITSNGTYTAEAKGTTEGIQKTGTAEIKVEGKFVVEDFDRYLTEGKIDIVWLDKNNNIIETPNAPKLTGNMQPIKLNTDGTDFETTDKSNWGYNYANKQWANMQTGDGSMFVWIPRYAYKITYYNSDKSQIVGYSNSEGLVNAKGEVVTPCEEGIETVGEYIVHPAFSKNAEVGGGWTTSNGENIEGFWVGKFEVSGSEKSLEVKPGVSSLRSMTINNQYKAGKSATFGEANSELIGSHMAKNSEWGAVAYLSHSIYGLEGVRIKNNSSDITGGNSTKSTIYTTNAGQSTTGNAYGVYDMSGGAWERTASYTNYTNGYFANGGTMKDDLYGSNTTEQNTSTKYKTVYKTSTNTQDSYNLTGKKKGDVIYETSSSNSSSLKSWFNVYSNFPDISSPFFSRGGSYRYSGFFAFSSSSGGSDIGNSFRVILTF